MSRAIRGRTPADGQQGPGCRVARVSAAAAARRRRRCRRRPEQGEGRLRSPLHRLWRRHRHSDGRAEPFGLQSDERCPYGLIRAKQSVRRDSREKAQRVDRRRPTQRDMIWRTQTGCGESYCFAPRLLQTAHGNRALCCCRGGTPVESSPADLSRQRFTCAFRSSALRASRLAEQTAQVASAKGDGLRNGEARDISAPARAVRATQVVWGRQNDREGILLTRNDAPLRAR